GPERALQPVRVLLPDRRARRVHHLRPDERPGDRHRPRPAVTPRRRAARTLAPSLLGHGPGKRAEQTALRGNTAVPRHGSRVPVVPVVEAEDEAHLVRGLGTEADLVIV